MKKRLLSLAAATVIATGGLVAGLAGPASADDGILCMTTENAPLYANVDGSGGSFYLFTLSGGRGFRWSGMAYGIDDQVWIYGHGAEHPDRDGWVLASHTNC